MDQNIVVEKSAEYAFLNMVERLKRDPNGWFGVRVHLSRKIKHDDMLQSLSGINGHLRTCQNRATEVCDYIAEQATIFDHAHIYKFKDGDIVLLAHSQRDSETQKVKDIAKDVSTRFGTDLCEFHSLVKDMYVYQKLSDAKLLSMKRIDAYEQMSDKSIVRSIPIRRNKREEPLVMFVEDDKFTSTHACNILNKEFEVIPVKTGEEAILKYIEHAPDMVFLDIHLPGLSGFDTLKSIKKIDPKAYVVMLSVDTVKRNIVDTNHNGASGFIKKPFSKTRLITSVHKSPYIKASASSSYFSDMLN